MLEILGHTPPWVWTLLAALTALGLWQTRTQRLARARLVVLPAVMLALGLNASWASFTVHPALFAAWLGAFLLATLVGRRWRAPAGTAWDAAAARLVVPGSWLPLALILVVFCLRYGISVGFVLNPGWRDALALLAGVSMLYGAVGGVFAGRALGLWALTRRATMPRDALQVDARAAG